MGQMVGGSFLSTTVLWVLKSVKSLEIYENSPCNAKTRVLVTSKHKTILWIRHYASVSTKLNKHRMNLLSIKKKLYCRFNMPNEKLKISNKPFKIRLNPCKLQKLGSLIGILGQMLNYVMIMLKTVLKINYTL